MTSLNIFTHFSKDYIDSLYLIMIVVRKYLSVSVAHFINPYIDGADLLVSSLI